MRQPIAKTHLCRVLSFVVSVQSFDMCTDDHFGIYVPTLVRFRVSIVFAHFGNGATDGPRVASSLSISRWRSSARPLRSALFHSDFLCLLRVAIWYSTRLLVVWTRTELITVCSPPNVNVLLPPSPDHGLWMTPVMSTMTMTLI